LDYFLLGNPQHFNRLISFWARLPFAIALFGLGAWLALHGIQVVFGEYREEPVMITNDLFAYMRHPVYLGAILLYVAVLLLVLSPLAGLVLLAVLGLYQWLAKYEEDRMIGIFGDRYREYQKRVPMWLPVKFNK
jgi:protein-S-isoprenylcysteine O-methyltransferase Ste14